MSDWNGCVPYVGAIIERNNNGIREILVQTRWKPDRPSIYNGTLEFAAGVLDEPYESVYEALAREVHEETGLSVNKIVDSDKTELYSPHRVDAAIGFRPYCCTQQLNEGRPWVGFIFSCEVESGVPKGQVGETKDVHWLSASDFFEIFKNTPEKIFTLELPALDYYFRDLGYLSSEA